MAYAKFKAKPDMGPKMSPILRGEKKVGVVMSEFKHGKLRSGSGKKVINRKQAIAIALSEAKKSKRK